jgi:LmbE family N-acetylglucosaminyl deacetylase
MKKVGKGILVFLLILLVCSPLILIGWGRSMLHDSDVAKREELIPSSPQKRVLAIFPHPDDEVTVAGTVMGLKAAGHQVTLVCFTRGEKGNAANIPTEQELARLRTGEMQQSAQILGVDSLIQLDYADGGLDELGLDSLMNLVHALIQDQKPDVLLSYDSKVGLYGHSDHRLTGEAVEQVFLKHRGEQGNYPKEPGKGLPAPDFSIGTQPYFSRTLQVMQAHQTQKKVLQDLMPYHDKVPQWIYSRVFDREYFREVR